METIENIESLLDEIKEDTEKLEKKRVKAAAPRIRKKLMQIIRICKALRQEAQITKNNI